MTSAAGKKALAGEEVWIEGDQFHIKERMNIAITGASCFVLDSEGNEVATIRKTGNANLEIGFRCDVMKAYTKFTKLK